MIIVWKLAGMAEGTEGKTEEGREETGRPVRIRDNFYVESFQKLI
jgi:hypothetical protein